MIVWEMFLIPVSMAVTAMSSTCTPQILDEPPDNITVPPGSSLTLNCSGTCQGFPVRLSWHFSNVSERDVGRGAFTCLNESSEEKTWCNYTLRNIKDSGWYYCKVTFDQTILLQEKSRRTRVDVAGNEEDALVTANPVTRNPGIKDMIQSKTFLIVSGVSALLLIVLVVMICVVQRRRRRHKEMTNPIYGNTRPPPAASRQQTSKSDPLVASRVPPKAQTPLKTKCRDVS